MAGEYRREGNFKVAFILTEELLKDCASTIEEALTSTDEQLSAQRSKMQFQVEFARSGEFSTDELEDVLALANSGTGLIRSITISTNLFRTPKVHMRFRNTTSIDSVSYSVTGNDRDTFLVAGRLDELVGRSRAWYSRLAHLDMVSVLLGLIVVAWVIITTATGLMAILGKYHSGESNAGDQAAAFVITMAALIVVTIAGMLLNQFRRWLFPVAIFAIGDERRREQKLQFWRSVLGIAIIIALVVNVVTALVL